MEYTKEMLNAMDEALKDREFTAKLAEAEDAEAIKQIFSEKGITIDDAIAQGALNKMNEIAANGGELSAEDLELVAGGCGDCAGGLAAIGGAVGLVFGPLGGIAGAVIGGCIGCAVGANHEITGKKPFYLAASAAKLGSRIVRRK